MINPTFVDPGIHCRTWSAASCAAFSRLGLTSSPIMLLLTSITRISAARLVGSGMAAIGLAMASVNSATAAT